MEEIVVIYIHLLFWQTGECVLRLLSTALHGQHLNDVIYRDVWFMGKSSSAIILYLLLLIYNLNWYYWVHASYTADRDEPTTALDN